LNPKSNTKLLTNKRSNIKITNSKKNYLNNMTAELPPNLFVKMAQQHGKEMASALNRDRTSAYGSGTIPQYDRKAWATKQQAWRRDLIAHIINRNPASFGQKSQKWAIDRNVELLNQGIETNHPAEHWLACWTLDCLSTNQWEKARTLVKGIGIIHKSPNHYIAWHTMLKAVGSCALSPDTKTEMVRRVAQLFENMDLQQL
jgi:hypothetical protein